MFESQFKFYSWGVAAVNKERGSMLLEVTPIEILNMLDGEVVPNYTSVEDKGIDGRGQEYNVKVTASNSIEATWLQWGSNRRTAPDVRRGEPIIILRYADSDVFYWVCAGLKDELRRLETVVFAISNTRDENVKVLNADNTYYMEWSSHDKHITLKTSKSDGEPFAYTVQINTKDGVFVVSDDDGNYWQLESKERRWIVTNKDNSIIKMDKKTIYQYAADLIHHKTKDYIIDSKTYKLTCETGEIKASTSFLIETPDLTLKGTTKALIDTPILSIENAAGAGTTTINGITTIKQTLLVEKLATFSMGWAMLPAGGAGPAAMTADPTAGMTSALPATFKDGANIVIDLTGGTILHKGVDIGKDHKHNVPTIGPSDVVIP